METFADYLLTIDNENHRARLETVFAWIKDRFPEMETRIAWNQPMFTDHGTFIIGFSTSKQHFSVAPESKAIAAFASQIEKSGYSHGSHIFRIRWTDEVDYPLLERIIQYNRTDKADCTTFWRK